MAAWFFAALSASAATTGTIFVELRNTLGMDLPGRVEFYRSNARQPEIRVALPKGSALQECSPGDYEVFVYAYDYDLEMLVDVQKVSLKAGKTEPVLVEISEGIGKSGIRAWDQDFDGVVDRVETAYGTDPYNPIDFPKAEPIPFDSPVLNAQPGWYKGDLHVRSKYSGGEETPAQLIQRAEQQGLDFIAIADRDTMAAVLDSGYRSDKVALIPALEWGNDEKGVALIYGALTLPRPAGAYWEAQTLCQRVQAQGGVFAVAHPCFSNAPWQWGLSYVNSIEVWARDWRVVPPMALDELMPEYQRTKDRRLIYSIALAADAVNNSANGQATLFWDYELVRGLKAGAIAGSISASPSVPMGRPLTHVYAREKSARGILEGIRLGRTFINAGPEAPVIEFTADAMKNGKTDVSLGGVVPLGMEVEFMIKVGKAKGMKVELLRNGHPILTKKVKYDNEAFMLTENTISYAVYRARVFTTPQQEGFGPIDVKAMTSPIYAQNIIPVDMSQDNPADIWLRFENSDLPPVKVTQKVTEDGREMVRTEGGPPDLGAIGAEQPFAPPPGEEVRTLEPKRF